MIGTQHDTPATMIGDVNLFLTPHDEDEDDEEERADGKIENDRVQGVVGEVEIMIAEKGFQGKGLGKEILLVFMWYVLCSVGEIMKEYREGGDGNGNGKEESCLRYLRVKIDQENVRSIRLFEGVGFKKVTEEADYFGELELRLVVSGKSRGEVDGRLDKVPQELEYKMP